MEGISDKDIKELDAQAKRQLAAEKFAMRVTDKKRCKKCGTTLEYIESGKSSWFECPTHGIEWEMKDA